MGGSRQEGCCRLAGTTAGPSHNLRFSCNPARRPASLEGDSDFLRSRGSFDCQHPVPWRSSSGQGAVDRAMTPPWHAGGDRRTAPAIVSDSILRYRSLLAGRHRKTLRHIYTRPVLAGIRWRDAVSLLGALGATVSERAGSRVAAKLNDKVAVFHRPHPRPEMDRAAVRDLRRFLESAGVEP